MITDQLLSAMKHIFRDAPYGVEHTLRVLENARAIAQGEGLSEADLQTITAAAILHDIGALEALRKHGSMDGPYQEQEGEPLARQILEQAGASPALTERVCYIVGHHHTPERIDGADFRVLWDADQLDNLEYGEGSREGALERFQTETGRRLAQERL